MTAPRLFFLLILALGGAALTAQADEFDTLRLKWRDTLTQGTNASPADPLYAGWIATVGYDAQRHWNQMATNSGRTFLWSDLSPLGSVSLRLTTSYSRLRDMALGYCVRGSSVETNAGLRAAILSGLDWIYTNHYNQNITTNNQYDNWYDWEIGTPLHLNDITVLMYSHLSTGQISNYMNAVEHFAPVPNLKGDNKVLTGANEVWKSSIVAVRGAIVKSSSKILIASAALSDVFPYVTAGDGFHADGSFVFHDVFAYNGGYGAELIGTLGPLKQWLNSSTWQVTDPAQTNLFRWVHEAFQPLIYRGAMMQMVSGRYYTRHGDDHLAGHDIIASILRLAQIAPPADAAAFKSMVKEWLAADTARDFIATQPPPYNVWAQAVWNDPNIVRRGELVGHYTFPQMDRAAHLRPGWGFGLSMASSRIGNYESIRGENLRGWYTGEGMTYLYLSDLDHYADGFWPGVNPYRLPGTTVDTIARANASGEEYLSPNNWTGGASVQGFGVAGMHLNSWAGTLSARKSWFMFDNEVVCLGAGISSTDNRTIETTVENRRLAGYGNNPFIVNGTAKPSNVGWQEDLAGTSWAHLLGNVPGADIGYYFPQPATVRAVREARAGALEDLNSSYGSADRASRNFLTLWLDHGASPSNATYAYVLLPSRSASQVAAYSAAPDITVIENQPRFQCVRDNVLGVTAANFWQDALPNRVGGMVCDKKASVLFRHDGSVLEVGLTDPTQTNIGVIYLDLTNSASAVLSFDAGVTVLQTTPAIRLAFNVNALGGRTLRARFLSGTPLALTLSPVADTYAQNGDQTNTNFGSAVTLGVKSSGTSQAREAFLRFDLAAARGTLQDATLRLVPSSLDSPIYHALALVTDNSWTESGLTWNNKPPSDPEFTRWLVTAVDAPVTATLTALVQPAQVAGGKISLRISSTATPLPTNSFVSYRSRENGTVASRPQLNLGLIRFPPTVQLTSAADGSLLDAPATVTLAATAADADGAVTAVEFYQGATRVGQTFAPPHVLTLPGLAAGSYSITAVATDQSGLMATSAPVTCTVFNPEPIGRGTGLFGEYYTNDNLTGPNLSPILTRTDMNIYFLWGNGSPAVQVPPDRFSVRWTGRLQTRHAGWHSFHTVTDEGVRLWIDGRLIIDRWSDHPVTEHTGVIALEPGRYYPLMMEYREKTSNATAQLWWTEPGGVKEVVPQSQLYPSGSGLRGAYCAGTNLTAIAFTRIDPTVNFAWSNSTPDPSMLTSNYSIRWSGRVRTKQAGNYTFSTLSDDGVKLTVQGQVLINNWTVHPPTLNSATLPNLSAGQLYTVSLEYFNHAGDGTVVLMWTPPGESAQVIPSSNLTASTSLNNPPALTPLPNPAAIPGGLLTFTATATDPDAPPQKLIFTLDPGAPAGAAMTTNGLFTWTPPVSQPPGDYPVIIRVSDDVTPPMTDAQVIIISVVSNAAVAPVTFVPTGSAWRYLDNGIDPGPAWRGIGYSDAVWKTGPAPLGYGGGEATIVSFGLDPANKPITTWFRRAFHVPSASFVQSLGARLARDDGAVVYLNGAEVWRDNLPGGTVNASTLALTPITGPARTNFLSQPLNPALLVDGANVMAVEMHQSAPNGPDLRLDFELTGTALVPAQAALSIVPSASGATLIWPADAGLLQLYTASSLAQPVAWLRATNPPVLSNGFWMVPLPPGTNRAQFYRLQTP